MDIAFQGQKGEWLFLITIVCIDTTEKKAKGYQRGGREWEKEMAGLALEETPSRFT